MMPPSVSRAAARAARTAARFPLALGSGALVFVACAVLIEGPDRPWISRLALAAGLGLPLFTAAVTSAERLRWSARGRLAASAGLAAAVALIFVRALSWTDSTVALRFAQLGLAAHLLVAVGPYLVGGNRTGFWQYNRFLFLRYLTATFYAFVLWAGLAIALVAIDKLLGVRAPSEWYGHLAAFLAFVFHPWFFLAGVPADYEALDRNEDYPLGLKVFTQFVLLPLVAVYLTILTLYLGRVLITRSWPSGWIGYLVSSVAAAGVLALLLVHPIRERSDSRWVNAYGRWFFVAILPSVVMLLLAIGQRVGQYGVTERRYLLLVLALWMLGIALFYALTGSRNIRLIPVSLAAVALVTWFGPWGAYQVSLRSQIARLDQLLRANDLGRAGAAAPNGRPVSLADRRELSAIFDYLEVTRGAGAVARALGVPDSALAAGPADTAFAATRAPGRAMRRIGLVYVGRWEVAGRRSDGRESFWIQERVPGADTTQDIRGFEALRPFAVGDTLWVVRLGDPVTVRATWAPPRLRVTSGGRPEEDLDLNPDFLRAARGARSRAGGIPGPMVVDRETADLRIRLIWTQLAGDVGRDSVRLHSVTGAMLVGRRHPE